MRPGAAPRKHIFKKKQEANQLPVINQSEVFYLYIQAVPNPTDCFDNLRIARIYLNRLPEPTDMDV